ncbi:transposase [Rhodococcus sp. NPDC060176]|uniref:transposase n=1 Tax=Rhodococcus sp. NPDC060176 TaxID=3347062 RepID=UPI003650DC32
MPRRYPPEFRRKVLDLLKSGRTVAEVAAALDVTEQTIYNWRNQAHRYRAKAGAELDRERRTRRRSTSPSPSWRPNSPSPNAPPSY